MSGYAEIWALSRSSWDKMPEDLSAHFVQDEYPCRADKE